MQRREKRKHWKSNVLHGGSWGRKYRPCRIEATKWSTVVKSNEGTFECRDKSIDKKERHKEIDE